MDTYLDIVQIMVSVVLLLIILSQVKEAGTGVFSNTQATFHTRRGLEKTMFQFTIILAAIFLLISIFSARERIF